MYVYILPVSKKELRKMRQIIRDWMPYATAAVKFFLARCKKITVKNIIPSKNCKNEMFIING